MTSQKLAGMSLKRTGSLVMAFVLVVSVLAGGMGAVSAATSDTQSVSVSAVEYATGDNVTQGTVELVDGDGTVIDSATLSSSSTSANLSTSSYSSDKDYYVVYKNDKNTLPHYEQRKVPVDISDVDSVELEVVEADQTTASVNVTDETDTNVEAINITHTQAINTSEKNQTEQVWNGTASTKQDITALNGFNVEMMNSTGSVIATYTYYVDNGSWKAGSEPTEANFTIDHPSGPDAEYDFVNGNASGFAVVTQKVGILGTNFGKSFFGENKTTYEVDKTHSISGDTETIEYEFANSQAASGIENLTGAKSAGAFAGIQVLANGKPLPSYVDSYSGDKTSYVVYNTNTDTATVHLNDSDFESSDVRVQMVAGQELGFFQVAEILGYTEAVSHEFNSADFNFNSSETSS